MAGPRSPGHQWEAMLPTGMSGSRVTVAFAVEDPAAAREALGDLAAVGNQPV